MRGFIAWKTENNLNTHTAVDDFYRNKTQCVTHIDDVAVSIDFSGAVHFNIEFVPN